MKVTLIVEEDSGRETRLLYPSVASFSQTASVGGWMFARWKVELPADTDWLGVE